MTDAEREGCLRRLSFPRELEQTFQLDYYQQILPTLRIGLALMSLILLGQGFGWYLRSNVSYSLLPLVVGRPIPPLTALAVTYWRGFWRYWQAYFVFWLCVGMVFAGGKVGQSVSASAFWSSPASRLGFFATVTLYLMVMLSGLLRLQFRWAAASQVLLVGFTLREAMAYVGLPAANILLPYGFLILPALVIVLFAAHSHERLQRSAFLSSHLLEIERRRSESILRNTLPGAIVDRLMASDALIADDHVEVTVLFGDIADFTPWSADRSAHEVLEFLNRVFSRFDRLVETQGLEKIKTVGDCYMVIAGAPIPRADHVEAAARLALAMRAEAECISAEQGTPTRFRMGMHTGPLAAGVIGEKRFLYDVWGDTVNTASRLESYGVPGAIQVSAQVAERLRGRFVLTRRGEIEIKGKGLLETYFLESELSEPEGGVSAPVPSEDIRTARA